MFSTALSRVAPDRVGGSACRAVSQLDSRRRRTNRAPRHAAGMAAANTLPVPPRSVAPRQGRHIGQGSRDPMTVTSSVARRNPPHRGVQLSVPPRKIGHREARGLAAIQDALVTLARTASSTAFRRFAQFRGLSLHLAPRAGLCPTRLGRFSGCNDHAPGQALASSSAHSSSSALSPSSCGAPAHAPVGAALTEARRRQNHHQYRVRLRCDLLRARPLPPRRQCPQIPRPRPAVRVARPVAASSGGIPTRGSGPCSYAIRCLRARGAESPLPRKRRHDFEHCSESD